MLRILLILASGTYSTCLNALPSGSLLVNKTPSSVTRIVYCGQEIASSGIHHKSFFAGSNDFLRQASNAKTVDHVTLNAEITVTYRFCAGNLKIDVINKDQIYYAW